MPQRPLTIQDALLQRVPQAANVQLPAEGQDTWLDSLMHRVGVASGVSEQKPGDAGDAAAATAGLFGPAALHGAGGAAMAVTALPFSVLRENVARLLAEAPEEIRPALQALSEKYPRVLGHVDKIHYTNGPQYHEGVGQSIGQAGSSRPYTIPLYESPEEFPRNPNDVGAANAQIQDSNAMQNRDTKFSSLAVDTSGSPANINRTLGHELNHAAQRIALGPNFSAKYMQQVGPNWERYSTAPFEVSSENVGDKIAGMLGPNAEAHASSNRADRLGKRLIENPLPPNIDQWTAENRGLLLDTLKNNASEYIDPQGSTRAIYKDPSITSDPNYNTSIRQQLILDADRSAGNHLTRFKDLAERTGAPRSPDPWNFGSDVIPGARDPRDPIVKNPNDQSQQPNLDPRSALYELMYKRIQNNQAGVPNENPFGKLPPKAPDGGQ